ncbi:hypothetical protein PO124_02200 [Bacillus licheniformis]|nr:hypothetical protein [Bacillus licheniformis]
MMGIDPQTPFVIGASDGVLSNLGVNAIKKAKSPSPSGQAARFARLSMSRKPMKRQNLCYALTETIGSSAGQSTTAGSSFAGSEMNLLHQKSKPQTPRH